MGIRNQLSVLAIDTSNNNGKSGGDDEAVFAEAHIIHDLTDAFRDICKDMHPVSLPQLDLDS
jgi:hypothetical protein